MILLISKGKKARVILAGNRKQIVQDAETAIFGIARGLLEHDQEAFGKLLNSVGARLGDLTKEMEAEA
jgi:hypothetical protein